MAAQFNILGSPARDLFHNLWIDPNLVDLFPLNEKSGTIYGRSKTNRLTGTVSGNPTYGKAIAQGFVGLDFDGTGDYVVLSGGLAFERTDTFSGLAVVTTDDVAADSVLVGKANTTGWYWGVDSSQRPFLTLTTAASGAIRVNANAALTVPTAYMIGFSYSGSGAAAGVLVYRNGLVEADTDATDTLAGDIANAASAQISGINGNNNLWSGDQSFVVLFNAVKTAQDFRRWASLGRFLG